MEEALLEVVDLAVLYRAQRLPDRVVAVKGFDKRHRVLCARVALNENDVRVGGENGLKVDVESLRVGGSVPRVDNVLRVHGADHAAYDRAGGVGLKRVGGREHAEYGRIVFCRAFEKHVDHVVESLQRDLFIELRMSGQVREDLEPLEVIGEIVVAHRDDRNTGGFGGSLYRLVPAHSGRANDEVGLESDDRLCVPLLSGGRGGDRCDAVVRGDIPAYVLFIERDRGIAADAAGNGSARLIPEGREACVEVDNILRVLRDRDALLAGRVGEGHAVIVHDDLVRLLEKGRAKGVGGGRVLRRGCVGACVSVRIGARVARCRIRARRLGRRRLIVPGGTAAGGQERPEHEARGEHERYEFFHGYFLSFLNGTFISSAFSGKISFWDKERAVVHLVAHDL